MSNRQMRPPRQSQLQESCANDHEAGVSGDSGDEEETPGEAELAESPQSSVDNEPRHMRFYRQKPGWLRVLECAKNKFRLHICTNAITPFPTVEHHSAAATACITEAMSDFRNENKTTTLSDGIYSPKVGNLYSRLMIPLRSLYPAPSPDVNTRKIHFTCTIRLLKQQVPAIQ